MRNFFQIQKSILKNSTIFLYSVITLLLLCLVVITIRFQGCYYESYQEIINNVIGGVYTYGMLTPDFLAWHWRGARIIFNFLYNLNPSIAWVDYWLTFLQFVSITYLFLNFLIACKIKSVGKFSIIVIVLLYFAFVYDSFVLHQITRASGWAVVAGMSPLMRNLRTDGKLFGNICLYIAGICLFFLGCWVRFDSSAGHFILLVAIYVMGGGRIKFLLPYMVIFIFFFGVFCVEYFDRSEYYRYFSFEVEYNLFDRSAIKPLSSMTNKEDSAKYLAATYSIVADSVNLNPAFYNKMLLVKKVHAFDYQVLLRAVREFKLHILDRYWLISQDVLLFMVIALSIRGGKSVYKILLLYISYFALLFTVAYLLKMEDWFLCVFHASFFISIFMLYVNFDVTLFRKVIISILLFFAAIANFNLSYNTIATHKKQHHFITSTNNYLKSKFSNKIIVISNELPISTPYHVPDFSPFQKVYYFNYSMFPLCPAYRPFLENECNCNIAEFSPFFKYLYLQKDRVVIIDKSERIKVLATYLNVIHNQHYNFNYIDSIIEQETFTGEKLSVFELRN